MRLSLYFFRQYLPSFLFGLVLFSFIFVLDKLFDLIDLILNKGVPVSATMRLFGLFVPTTFPLALPMSILLACMVTFGRLSEENELTAVRAAGISLMKALWIIPLFGFLISFALIPFNTTVAPHISKTFRTLYEQIIRAEPLINVTEKNFFSIKNIKIYAHSVNKKKNELKDLFVYQVPHDGRPAERIFARSGLIEANENVFNLVLRAGQLQRYDLEIPGRLIHTAFGEYKISIPLNMNKEVKSRRLRLVPSAELKDLIKKNKEKGLKAHQYEAELHLRYALAFAPFCFVLIGVPLATSLKRGGRTFNTGLTIVVIFVYYLLLILGLTLAEKGVLWAPFSLWIANSLCIGLGIRLGWRMIRQ